VQPKLTLFQPSLGDFLQTFNFYFMFCPTVVFFTIFIHYFLSFQLVLSVWKNLLQNGCVFSGIKEKNFFLHYEVLAAVVEFLLYCRTFAFSLCCLGIASIIPQH